MLPKQCGQIVSLLQLDGNVNAFTIIGWKSRASFIWASKALWLRQLLELSDLGKVWNFTKVNMEAIIIIYTWVWNLKSAREEHNYRPQ